MRGHFYQQALATTLREIEAHDTDYASRYALVFQALHQALRCGYAAGFRFDPSEPEWPVAFIELPTGQVSWHMPEHHRPWDGHSTEEKYRRCRAFAEDVR